MLFYTSFVFLTGFAQNVATDTSAPVVAYWRLGDKKNLTIKKTVEQTQDGKPTKSSNNTYEVSLRVIDSTKENYTVEWIYKDGGSEIGKNPSLKDFNSLLTNLKIVYKTDEVGSFEELVNYDEIRRFLNQAIDLIVKQSKDTVGMRAVVQQLNQVFSTREGIEQLVLRDITLYHAVYGVEYSVHPTVTETTLPNFLGGDPWPATVSMKLAQPQPKQNSVQVIIDQEIDQVKAAAIIKQLAQKMAAATGKEVSEKDLPSYLMIKDHSEFDVILSSGWIKRAYMKRLAKSDDVGKTEIYEMVLR